MASNINPNNIDGAYPVAGQDNNSQGFRDNFTNTKTNFQYAADEITDLQNNAILKSALSGTTLDNNLNGSLVYGGVIRQFSATRAALGTLSGSVTINYASGSFQTLTTSGSVSLAFSNFPASGSTALVSVEITVASAAHTVTVPAAVSVNTSGLAGINTATNVITFGAAGVYTLQFVTSDGGTTITLNQVNSLLQALNASSEDLDATAAANLGVSDSYFSTSGAETATLAAGLNGQVKTFAMYADGGDMVITVTNPGWGGSGTMTFSAVGQACTLKYINSKWFCIGNNGVAFA